MRRRMRRIQWPPADPQPAAARCGRAAGEEEERARGLEKIQTFDDESARGGTRCKAKRKGRAIG